MKVVVHHLAGCCPLPLAYYLKAMGVLRLVAEQKDPGARLWWQDEHAVLSCRLDEEELMQFFLQKYRPTPIIAPWNAGSGFYEEKDVQDVVTGDDKDTDDSGDEQAEEDAVASEDGKDVFGRLNLLNGARFDALKNAVRVTMERECVQFQQVLAHARAAKKMANKEKNDESLRLTAKEAEAAKKVLKDRIVSGCFQTWRGGQLEWLLASAVLTQDPKKPVFYPQHCGGSGGANGKLDFTKNFVSSIVTLLDARLSAESRVLLEVALFARTALENGAITEGRTTGMYLPNTIKSPNGTAGFMSDRKSNLWDLVLSLEGVICLQCGVSKKLNGSADIAVNAPFAVQSGVSCFGGGPVSGEKASAEQWMPIWNRPATLTEVKQLFAEGRSVVGRRASRTANDMARSLGRFGTQRGVGSFIRYCYPQRNGKGHLAVALGRWQVQAVPQRSLVDHASRWIESVVAASRKEAPVSWKASARRCEEALLACCRNGRDAVCWQQLLLTMGSAEAVLAQTPEKAAEVFLHPLSNLPGEWVRTLPNTPELRLALSLAGLVGTQDDENGTADYQQPVRIHFVPFPWDYERKRWDFYSFAKSGPELVATSGNLIRDAIVVLRRRLEVGRLSLRAGHGHYAAPTDVAAFLRGELDDALILALARPLMALAWKDASRLTAPTERCAQDDGVMNLYGLLRLAHLPTPLELPGKEPFRIRTDPAILARLLSGDAAAAFGVATRRLGTSGLRPHLRAAVADGPFARRLAASLIFPVHPETAAWLAASLCHHLFVS